MRFKNRVEAGHKLAATLEKYRHQHPILIYALPRGGVILGVIAAEYLGAPLSLVTPRKIGHPSYPEYAVAAVTEEGTVIADPAEIMSLDEDWLQAAINHEISEAKRYFDTYSRGVPDVSPENKTVIIIDDGVATGLTMLAAIYDIRQKHPSRIIAAAPVIPYDIFETLMEETDEVVALLSPNEFAGTISAYYDDFTPVDDRDITTLLRTATH